LIRAIQASISLPGLAPPVGGDGRLLVDGAMLNNLPVDVMAATGEGPVIAIDVMRSPSRAQMSPTRPVSRFERLTDRWIIRHDGSFQLPGIRETLTSTAMLSSSRRADANRTLAELVITPDLGDIQLLDWHRIDQIVAAGRLAGDHAIAAWQGR
jgi:NTE family protein